MKKVITYGSFDLFHEGHYKLLKRAKELGDYLIVGVTTEHYDQSRGKMNVVDSLMDRIEHVKQTGFADEIIIEDHIGQKVEDILKYDIDVFTVGSDWTGVFDYLKKYCEVVYLERTKDISSTMLRAKNYSIVKMGIIGSGRIARRFVPEAKYVSGINVECVYNPHMSSAKKFAKEFELNNYFDDFDLFLSEVDAVYVASPHETHYEYAKRALLKGKHVLCEKPMALLKNEVLDLYAIAKDKECIIMEGIKTAYCPGFGQVLSVARSGVIGQIRDVEACFTKLESENARELKDLEYGGSFLELASYTLLPIVKLLGTEYIDIRFDRFNNQDNIDIYSKAYIKFKDAVATAKTGLGVKSEGQLLISGTKGYAYVPSPWWLTDYYEFRFEDLNNNKKFFYQWDGAGLRYEIQEFISCIYNHRFSTARLRRRESIAMADVMQQFGERINFIEI